MALLMRKLILLTMALLWGAIAVKAGDAEALVRVSVAPMRATASHSSEQVSQALMGTPVRIVDSGGGWSLCVTPDGYRGYIIDHSLARKTPEQMKRWRSASRVMVTAPYELRAAGCAGSPVTDLVAGCILERDSDGLSTPDGRRLRHLPAGSVAPLEQLASGGFSPDALPEFAALYVGSPYLWGGLSSKGMDCSGLVRMAYMAQGRLLSRDARDQILEGEAVDRDSLMAGDLIFFGNPSTGSVTHVGIYRGGGEYVHSSQLVRVNSLSEDSPLYLPLRVVGFRRVSGVPLSELPEYF